MEYVMDEGMNEPQGIVPRGSHVVCSHAGSRYGQLPLPLLLAWSPPRPRQTRNLLIIMSYPTHEAVIPSLRVFHSLLTPQTEVINLQKQSRWQRVVPDWLLRPSHTPFTVWVSAALSDVTCDFIAMSTRCEAGRHSTTTSGEWRTWRPSTGKLVEQETSDGGNRGNLLTLTFLLNVAWKRRINS